MKIVVVVSVLGYSCFFVGGYLEQGEKECFTIEFPSHLSCLNLILIPLTALKDTSRKKIILETTYMFLDPNTMGFSAFLWTPVILNVIFSLDDVSPKPSLSLSISPEPLHE